MRLYKLHGLNNNIYQMNTALKDCILEDEFAVKRFTK